jgi:hypothetical protein
MRTRYQGPDSGYDASDPKLQRIAAEEMNAARNSVPGRKWTVEQRKFFKSWRNYYPSLAYARNDPDTLYVAIDHAARKAAINQVSFYNRYLLSRRLPYIVKVWWHGRRRRSKCFILRSALMEVLTKELCQEAKRQYVRRGRRRMADLERELDERRRAPMVTPAVRWK